MEIVTEEKQSSARLSTARSRELGEELRRVRHRARLSSSFLSEALGWSLGKLSKLETGSRGTSPWEIGTLLGRCGADKPTRDRVMAIANEPDTGSFLRLHDGSPDSLLALSVHEQTARAVTVYEPLTVPSLAQTEDYARAVSGNESVVGARAARQEVLRRPGGPQTVLFVHEAALRLVVGDHQVMRDQMLRLTLMCGWARMSLRVIPMTAHAHGVLRGPAALLTFTAPVNPVAYAETDTATVFHDAPNVVLTYKAKMRQLERLALNAEQSRAVFARWADAYDRENR
ncbi:helix-turn-helix domain-containing protein [Saccharothrix deserti]|uniref:helix-turn-helix domain-containing protein n=1 Tax=Saccharothrix deserti TaxID=2593674 RepID=UPI00131B0569|nr:helix-turn-helix transcriptional regulator [Saccharothrix deserti]